MAWQKIKSWHCFRFFLKLGKNGNLVYSGMSLTRNFTNKIFLDSGEHRDLQSNMTEAHPTHQAFTNWAVIWKKGRNNLIPKLIYFQQASISSLRKPAKLYFPRTSGEAMAKNPIKIPTLFGLPNVFLRVGLNFHCRLKISTIFVVQMLVCVLAVELLSWWRAFRKSIGEKVSTAGK